MKNCGEYTLALSALLDGELNEQERQDTLAHLASCDACRAYFAELTAMHDLLSDTGEIALPEDFSAGVIDRLHEEAKPTCKAVPRRKWMGLAACAAIVVMVGALALPNLGGDAKSAASAEMPMKAMAAPAEQEYSEESASVQYFYAESAAVSEDSVPDMAAANGVVGLARIYALSDEAEQYLIEQGCEIYEMNDEICSYHVPIEIVYNMAALGLIDENDEDLVPLEEIAEGSAEVVVRMAEVGGASASENDPSDAAGETTEPAIEEGVQP